MISDRAVAISYDRRGFGETPASHTEFSHAEDLLAVIDALGGGACGWRGRQRAAGRTALDAACIAPERVAGMLLLAPGVSGAPDPELDADTARLVGLLEAADAGGDLAAVNRLETWLWLDGPAQPEGRVGGEIRSLALEMIGIVLRRGAQEDAGQSRLDAWSRLEDVQVPVTVACDDLDVPFIVERPRSWRGACPTPPTARSMVWPICQSWSGLIWWSRCSTSCSRSADAPNA